MERREGVSPEGGPLEKLLREAVAQAGRIREVHPDQKNPPLALGMLIFSYSVYRLMKFASPKEVTRGL